MSRICIWLLGGVLLCAGCDAFKSAEARLSEARDAVAQGNYNAAAVQLQLLADRDKGGPEAALLLAQVQLWRGEVDAAAAALEEARVSSADPGAVAALEAQVALERGQYDELLRSLDGSSGLADQSRNLLRARALQMKADTVEALRIYDQLLAEDPDLVEAHVHAAECHARLGRQVLAADHVDRALALQPDNAEAWALKSQLLLPGSPSESQSALQQALDNAPGQLGVREQVALLLRAAEWSLRNSDVEGTRSVHDSMVRLLPQAPLTRLLGAQLSLVRGQPSEAVVTLQHLIAEAPDFTAARLALVGGLLAAGSLELAAHEAGTIASAAPQGAATTGLVDTIKQAASAPAGSVQRAQLAIEAALALNQTLAARVIIRDALSSHPDDAGLLLTRAQLNLRDGDIDAALSEARLLVERTPESREARLVLAGALAAGGDQSAAADIYKKLQAESPTAIIAVALAQMDLAQGRGDALDWLTRWLADHPADATVRMMLAVGAQQIGQRQRAISEYERILSQQPQNVIAMNNLAWLYWQSKDQRALPLARRAFERGASSSSIADTYGWLLAESGDLEAALPVLEQAATAAPANPTIRFHFGTALARRGTAADREAARAILEDVLRYTGPFEGRGEAEAALARLPGAP